MRESGYYWVKLKPTHGEVPWQVMRYNDRVRTFHAVATMCPFFDMDFVQIGPRIPTPEETLGDLAKVSDAWRDFLRSSQPPFVTVTEDSEI